MGNKTIHLIGKSSYLWFIGWLSLGLVEVGFRLTLSPPPMTLMIFFTLLVYSLVGVVLGSLFGIIFLLIQRIGRGLKRPDNLTHFSLAACISIILFLYALLFFLKVGVFSSSPNFVFKSLVLFSLSVVVFFIFPFFSRWMDRKRSLFVFQLSILPSIWIVTSLILNRNKGLLPPVLQVTTFSRVLLLILGSILCFFLLYLLFSQGRRFLNRWKGSLLLKPRLIIVPFMFLFVFLFLLLREEDKQNNKIETKNAPTGKPNIILITLDTVRADHLSCYGYQRVTTPNLDTFSQECVVFKDAYATAAWTLPSHASMFTGMYPTKHGAVFKSVAPENASIKVQEGGKADFESAFGYYIFRLPEEYLTLAEILSAEGYRTGGIIGGPFTSAIFGLGQGFDYYDEDFLGVDKDINSSLIYQIVDLLIPLKDFVVQHGYSDTKRLASDLNKAAFRWLEKNREQPFFLFMNYFDPHNPYLPPPPYDEYFGKVESSVIVKPNPERDKNIRTAESTLILSVLNGNHQLTDEEKVFLVSLYDGEIRYLDNCVGQLFARLKALGVYDNTLIIVTSDHGEAFGEHKQVDHGRTLYDVLLRVPLLIKYPSSNPQRGTVAKRVSLVDLMPTILSFLGYPIPAGIDGHPLSDSERPIIAEWHPKWFEIEKYRRDLRAVYQEGKKYIWASNSLHELYDLEKDPDEEENIIAKFPQKAEAMQRTLNQWLSSFTPPDTKGEEVKINKSTVEKLRGLGYVR